LFAKLARKMKTPAFAVASFAAAIVAVLVQAPVQAQVYRCDSESGVPVYQGSPSGSNCRAIDMAPLTTIPAPNLPAPKAGATGKGATPAAAKADTPASFPRVDSGTQRTRDSDRRTILEAELRKEEERLAELEGEFKGGTPDRLGGERNYQKYLDRVERLKGDIGRSEANIASLKRELSAIKE